MANNPLQRNPAIESLKEKMSRDPFSRAFLQLAEEYRREGRYEDAIKVCLEGLSRHPGYHTARIALGRTYLEAGSLEQARQALAEVLALAPENHLAGKLLAEVQRRMGDTSGAAETYRSILVHYPGDVEVKALLQDLVGAPPAPVPGPPLRAAHAVLPAAAARRPADPVLDYRSEDLAAAGVTPLPMMPEREAAGAPDRDALQTNTLAELYLRQGLVERALDVYRAMLRVDPGNARVRRRLTELSGTATPAPEAMVPGTTQAVSPEPFESTQSPTATTVVSAPSPVLPRIATLEGVASQWIVPQPAGLRPSVPRPAVAPERSRARIARLEGWLERIHSAGKTGAAP